MYSSLSAECLVLCAQPLPACPAPTSPNPLVPTPASGRSRSCPRSHRCTDGCRREPGAAGRTQGIWGKGGGGEVAQLQGRCCCHQRRGCSQKTALHAPPRPLTPCPYSLPSITEPQPPPQERLPVLKGVPGLRLDKSWVDPSTPPRRQHCAKSC